MSKRHNRYSDRQHSENKVQDTDVGGGHGRHVTASETSGEAGHKNGANKAPWPLIIPRSISKLDWPTLGTWVLAAVAILTLVDVHDSAIVQERAWVGVADAVPSNYVRLADGHIQMEITFSLRNYGHSAAQHVQVFPELEISSKKNRYDPACKPSYERNDLGYVVLPTEILPTVYGLGVTLSDVIEGLKEHPAGDRNLFFKVIGCVVYSDAITKRDTHHTPFSYTLQLKDRTYVTADTEKIEDTDMYLQKLIVDPGTAN